jgi:YVTN family beta-propeller protein
VLRRFLPAVLLLTLPALAPAADPAKVRQKLYVTNSAGDDVTVIDVATNKPIGSIEVGPHPHGIAAPAAQDVIYVTIEGHGRDKAGELVWIDPRTDKVTRRMDIGPEPNQLAVTPDGKFAYVPVNDARWEVIDLAKGKVVERIPAGSGSRPHNTLCSADGKHMYLAPMGSPHKVLVADTSTHKVVGEIKLSDVVRPIALSPDEKRLYANVDGLVGIEVADVATRKKIDRVPAELTAEQKKVGSRSHGVGVRPDGKEVWTCDVNHFQVQVFDVTGERPKQTHTVPIGTEVYWLTFRPDGKVCYVSARGGRAVAAVDTATKEVVARIPVGKEPKRLLVVTLAEKK